ncbi:MAG: hypothetical protein HY720_22790 [Planctomycetes bacterium]|nr:hypothetical protein [Planctomycetota bacterium]
MASVVGAPERSGRFVLAAVDRVLAGMGLAAWLARAIRRAVAALSGPMEQLQLPA